jgi:hypothetical protein
MYGIIFVATAAWIKNLDQWNKLYTATKSAITSSTDTRAMLREIVFTTSTQLPVCRKLSSRQGIMQSIALPFVVPLFLPDCMPACTVSMRKVTGLVPAVMTHCVNADCISRHLLLLLSGVMPANVQHHHQFCNLRWTAAMKQIP